MQHQYALEVLRNELEQAESQVSYRKELWVEWKELSEYRRKNLSNAGEAEAYAKINKDNYIMSRLRVLSLKHSIETLESDIP